MKCNSRNKKTQQKGWKLKLRKAPRKQDKRTKRPNIGEKRKKTKELDEEVQYLNKRSSRKRRHKTDWKKIKNK